MRVVAFAPSASLVLLDVGGVKADGFPITGFGVAKFPDQITLPMLLAAYTEKGMDYDTRRYIVAKSPDGERLTTLECSWHWPDQPAAPVKFWAGTYYLTFLAG